MPDYLLVPVHLDALCLAEPLLAVDAMVDFSRLPYTDGRRDFNSTIANVSENLVTQPFQNQTLRLERGVHLHWSLPDTLTRGRHDDSGTTFPRVPNRWLVTRTLGDGQGASGLQQWIVESDYLYPEGQGATSGSISYPVPPSRQGPRRQPFRYLGRRLAVEELHAEGVPGEYLDELTALGYGEPSFAAFYPNCRSVFGMHDALESVDVPASGLVYDLVGWYADPDHDFLRTELQRFRAALLSEGSSSPTREALHAFLAEDLAWQAPPDRAVPERMACYARLRIAGFSPQEAGGARARTSPSVTIALGNSPTEALSALLADELSAADNDAAGDAAKTAKARIEDQLEALHLLPALEERQLDLRARFEAARHEASFAALPGGSLWTIRAESDPRRPADSQEGQAQNEIQLGPVVAEQLDRLNRLQRQFDAARDDLDSLRRRLFADWYKYQLAAHPPQDARDDYPDIDRIKHFIESQDLAPFDQINAATGDYDVLADTLGNVVRVVPRESSAAGALAARIAATVGELLASLDAQNQAPWLLSVGDVVDWSFVFARLGNEPRPAPLQRLWDRLSATAHQDLRQSRDPEVNQRVVDALNEVLRDRDLYDAEAFRRVDMPAALRDLLDADRSDWPTHHLVRVNRALLGGLIPLRPAVAVTTTSAYRLRLTAAPRFWEPREPAVLIAGDVARPTERHGADGLVACSVIDAAQGLAGIQSIRAVVATLENQDDFGLAEWKHQPWNPFLLEWEAAFSASIDPHSTNRDRDPDLRADEIDYQPHIVRDGFELRLNAQELAAPKPLVGEPDLFSGRAILTRTARKALVRRLQELFQREGLLDEAGQGQLPTADAFLQKLSASARPATGRDHPVATALRVWHRLHDSNPPLYVLAQALDGLHEALRMHESTFQLPIEDPLGFVDYRAFAERIREAVRGEIRGAPQPSGAFHPIRAGLLTLNGLRLIDTFGQVRDVRFEEQATAPTDVRAARVVRAEAMEIRGELKRLSESAEESAVITAPAASIWLPPRLVQPARLSFRWLAAAAASDAETNDHPGTSPVCGWLLPNYLDHRIMCYDASGTPLGSIDAQGTWRPAPGRHGHVIRRGQPMPPAVISDPTLGRIARWMIDGEPGLVADFLSALDSALENIDPENFAGQRGLSLLIGRPIAVVRAAVSLEMQGQPDVHQGWASFVRDMGRHRRADRGVRAVEFPVRLGEHRQLNDGLLGYWKEAAGGGEFSDNTFYSPQSQLPDRKSASGRTLIDSNTEDDLFQSIEAAPQAVTMLVDPRGEVHATCGILPAKAISIPPEQYAAALDGLRVTFLTAPVLTDRGAMNLPDLPADPGFAWSWIEQRQDERTEITFATLGKARVEATFAAAQELREGWLLLAPADDTDQSPPPNREDR